MDLDQLEKRVEWLDEERRKDKATIAELQKRLAKLEGAGEKTAKELKELDSATTRLGVQVTRAQEFDAALASHRKEVKAELDAQEKRAKRREQDARKRVENDLEAVNRAAAGFKEQAAKVAKFNEELVAMRDLTVRIERDMNELNTRLTDLTAKDAEDDRAFQTFQADQRAEAKRLADMQGEVTTLRKRADEMRARLDLFGDTQKKTDARLAEFQAAEAERREGQNAFMDKVITTQSERDRTWKEWGKRFEEVERQSEELATLIQNVGETERALKRAQEKFDEITGQLNRRINEITEMQRLGEERFRQEWATFRADDQKRWTNYLLTQEEVQKETGRHLTRLGGQLTDLEDNLQDLRDAVQHLGEGAQKLVQGMQAMFRDWMAESEQFSNTAG
jgi:chromosome segregation ATPase